MVSKPPSPQPSFPAGESHSEFRAQSEACRVLAFASTSSEGRKALYALADELDAKAQRLENGEGQ